MRIFAISDLHLDETHSKPMGVFGDIWEGQKEKILESVKKNKVKPSDVVIVAGDLSWAMRMEDAKKDLMFLEKLIGRVIIIRGNHDYWWQKLTAVKEGVPKNVTVLQNDAVRIGKTVFFGTRGWNIKENERYLPEDQKIYDREIIRMGLSLDEAKKLKQKGDKMVCIMHYPPFNSKTEDSGFTKMIEAAGVKKVVFGHLHGKRHSCKLVTEKNKVKYFLTSCDQVGNELVKI